MLARSQHCPSKQRGPAQSGPARRPKGGRREGSSSLRPVQQKSSADRWSKPPSRVSPEQQAFGLSSQYSDDNRSSTIQSTGRTRACQYTDVAPQMLVMQSARIAAWEQAGGSGETTDVGRASSWWQAKQVGPKGLDHERRRVSPPAYARRGRSPSPTLSSTAYMPHGHSPSPSLRDAAYVQRGWSPSSTVSGTAYVAHGRASACNVGGAVYMPRVRSPSPTLSGTAYVAHGRSISASASPTLSGATYRPRSPSPKLSGEKITIDETFARIEAKLGSTINSARQMLIHGSTINQQLKHNKAPISGESWAR